MKKLQLFSTLLMVAFLFSCSPERKLKRANKKLVQIIQQYPLLVQSDTIFRHDTLIAAKTQHDTIFRSTITKDTVIIRENNLTVKYYNDGKTTYLKGVCDTIKIIREVPFIVNTVSPVKEVHVMKWYDYILYSIAFLAILFVVLDRVAHKLSK